MAIESPIASQTRPVEPAEVIPNEIPTYRAISPMAIASSIFGLISAFSYTNEIWIIAGVLAVITGVMAILKIRKMPDVMTGKSFAQAGIVLGALFSLSSVAYSQVSQFLLVRDSSAFAKTFVEQLNTRDAASCLWYMLPPVARKGILPEEAPAKMAQMLKDSTKVQSIDAQIRAMIKHLGPDDKIEFAEVESAFFYELESHAAILLKVGDGEHHDHDKAANAKPHQDGEETALLVVKAMPGAQATRWWVDQIRYPYVPKGYKFVPKAPDDGHGHSH